MADYDVFNGDADGILSLVQLRLSEPRPDAKLITGRKRDIDLLKQVEPNAGDRITVLDVSMRNNGDALRASLNAGAQVFYADHHNPGDIPEHDNLTAMIDTSPEMCTAMLIDDHLSGAHRAWAVTAAYGDNFPVLAKRKAEGLDLPLERLEQLGILINYNGYGASVDDLHFHPADLYRQLARSKTPMDFLGGNAETFERLDTGYREDMAGAQAGQVISDTAHGLVVELPNTASSRRVSGVYGHDLAQASPDPIILGGSYAAKLHIGDSGSNYYSGTIIITGMGELTIDIDEGKEVAQEYNFMFNGAVVSNGNVPALSV